MNDSEYTPLRTVPLEQIATYLQCNPERLATALRRLTEMPSSVEYVPGEHACITPAEVHYQLAPDIEVELLERLLRKPDGRAS
jgi:hypothetical protein